MIKMQLMVYNETEKKYYGHGEIELSFMPQVGFYYQEGEYWYIVDKIVFDKDDSIDLYLTKTDIDIMEVK